MNEQILNPLSKQMGIDKKFIPLVFDFSYSPISYIDPSWLINLDHHAQLVKIQEYIRQQKNFYSRHRVDKLLSQYIIDQLVGEPDSFDYTAINKRIILLPSDTLKEICFNLGLCCYSNLISHEIDKKTVTFLKKVLGDNAYLFTLKRIPFLAFPQQFIKYQWKNTNTLITGDKIHSKIPGRHLLFENDIEKHHLSNSIYNAGYTLLVHLLPKISTPLLLRFKLKFPYHWKADLLINKHNEKTKTDSYQALNLFFVNFIKELFPEWEALFV